MDSVEAAPAATAPSAEGRARVGQFAQWPEAYQDQELVSFSVLCASRAYETTDGQGRETVVVRARPDSGLYIEKFGEEFGR